jgi:hypothetical protein
MADSMKEVVEGWWGNDQGWIIIRASSMNGTTFFNDHLGIFEDKSS